MFFCLLGAVLSCGDGGIDDVLMDIAEMEMENEPKEKSRLNLGLSPYAIQAPQFDCDGFLNSIQQIDILSISWLHNTFGNDLTCLNRVFESHKDRIQTIQLYIMNTVCVRNRNCGEYEALARYSKSSLDSALRNKDPVVMYRIRKAAQAAADLLFLDLKIQDKGIECLISPYLEHDLSLKADFNSIEELRDIFPGCEFVSNPNSNIHQEGHEFIEFHHNFTTMFKPYIASLDGVSIGFEGIENNYPRVWPPHEVQRWIDAHEEHTYFTWIWSHSYNCIVPNNFIDPRLRPCDNSQDYQLIADFVINEQAKRLK